MERKSLLGYLKGLSAQGKEKGKRHEQEEILVIIKMGLMMGCKSMRERGGATPHPEVDTSLYNHFLLLILAFSLIYDSSHYPSQLRFQPQVRAITSFLGKC